MMTFQELINKAPKEIQEIIELLKEIEQNPEHHPEGCVYNHEKIVVNRAIKYGDIDIIIAALFHDLGKAFTTKMSEKGHWTSYGHEQKSSDIVQRYKKWIEEQGANYDIVYFIVSNHMRIHFIDKMKPSKVKALKSHPYFPKLEIFSKMDEMIGEYKQ